LGKGEAEPKQEDFFNAETLRRGGKRRNTGLMSILTRRRGGSEKDAENVEAQRRKAELRSD
jgi:hypothetical protein